MVLFGVLDQVVELDLWLKVEVRLQRDNQLPLGRAPAVLAHPGALGDVDLALVAHFLARDEGQHTVAIEGALGLDPCQLQNGRHQVLVLGVARDPLARRDTARVADDQRHVEGGVVDSVVVEPALMVVEGLAMVAVEDHDRLVVDTMRLQRREDGLDTGIHVRNSAVVLRDDIVLVRDSRRHPAREEVAEGLEAHHGVHGAVVRVGLIAMVEHPLVRRGRQVRRVRVHVAQEQKERGLALHQLLQLGDRDGIEVLGLGATALVPASPAGEVEVLVKPTGAGVAAKADTRSRVARFFKQLGEGGDFLTERAFVAERDHLGGEDILPRQHRAIGAGGGDVGADIVLKERPL